MSLKFIARVEPVTIGAAPDGTPNVYTMAQGVTFVVDNAPEFAQPASAQRIGLRLIQAFEGEEPVVELRQDDWELLSRVLEDARTPWGRWVQVQDERSTPLAVPPRLFLPWTNAVLEARNESPSRQEQLRAQARQKGEPA